MGAGVIGLLCAFELRQRGFDVIVVDKDEPGAGASRGNAGWIVPSLSGPVPQPGLVWTSLKWMLRPDSPLYIQPAALPRLLGWLWSFWRHCNAAAYGAGLAAVARLNRDTMDLFDRLAEAGVAFEMHRSGLLFVFAKPGSLDHLLSDLAAIERFGFGPARRLSADEVRELEPALRSDVAGGVLAEHDRHVRPESLVAGLVDWLRARGVRFLVPRRATSWKVKNGRVLGIDTDRGYLAADQVLLAGGAETGLLARQAGFRLPMQAGKGYSLTVERPRLVLRRPLYLEEARIACSPFDGALRISGTMELSGINRRLDPRRVEALSRNADRYLPGWREGDGVSVWTGMRPLLPDGLPAIGRAPGYENLFVAVGHAMLGVTLGPATAVAVADLMTRGESGYDLRPFDPGRFGR